jgi:hypothetical protein
VKPSQALLEVVIVEFVKNKVVALILLKVDCVLEMIVVLHQKEH